MHIRENKPADSVVLTGFFFFSFSFKLSLFPLSHCQTFVQVFQTLHWHVLVTVYNIPPGEIISMARGLSDL